MEADSRPWADWLSAVLGRPVRRWVTEDRLGVAAVEHGTFVGHAARLRRLAGDLEVVVADGGVARALDAAGVAFSWLHAVVPSVRSEIAAGSCRAGGDRPLACCGGAGPLPRHHPADARRVAQMFADRGSVVEVVDARCRAHLGDAGVAVRDAVDRLAQLALP